MEELKKALEKRLIPDISYIIMKYNSEVFDERIDDIAYEYGLMGNLIKIQELIGLNIFIPDPSVDARFVGFCQSWFVKVDSLSLIDRKHFIGMALEGACEGGYNNMVKFILNKIPKPMKSHVRATHVYMSTINRALRGACKGGYIDTVRTMISVLEVNDRWAGILNLGLTVACAHKQTEIIDFLIDLGATGCNSCDKSHELINMRKIGLEMDKVDEKVNQIRIDAKKKVDRQDRDDFFAQFNVSPVNTPRRKPGISGPLMPLK
jgi:hypothetical protein